MIKLLPSLSPRLKLLPLVALLSPLTAAQEASTDDTFSVQSNTTQTNIEPSPLAPPPELSSIDAAKVNVLSGLPVFQNQTLQIGQGVSQLSHTIASYDGKF